MHSGIAFSMNDTWTTLQNLPKIYFFTLYVVFTPIASHAIHHSQEKSVIFARVTRASLCVRTRQTVGVNELFARISWSSWKFSTCIACASSHWLCMYITRVKRLIRVWCEPALKSIFLVRLRNYPKIETCSLLNFCFLYPVGRVHPIWLRICVLPPRGLTLHYGVSVEQRATACLPLSASSCLPIPPKRKTSVCGKSQWWLFAAKVKCLQTSAVQRCAALKGTFV